MSSMIALAPSNRRSRWRSRNAGWPALTRRPSQTPSPRTKPESNTDTTARLRGTSSPLTQIRTSSLRGSSLKSYVPCAITSVRVPRIHRARRQRPPLPGDVVHRHLAGTGEQSVERLLERGERGRRVVGVDGRLVVPVADDDEVIVVLDRRGHRVAQAAVLRIRFARSACQRRDELLAAACDTKDVGDDEDRHAIIIP